MTKISHTFTAFSFRDLVTWVVVVHVQISTVLKYLFSLLVPTFLHKYLHFLLGVVTLSLRHVRTFELLFQVTVRLEISNKVEPKWREQ